LIVGLLEGQRAGRPAPAVQKFTLPIDLNLDAPRAMIAELAIELLAVVPDGLQMLAGLPLPRRRGPVVGRVERLLRAHGRLDCSVTPSRR
jgi:hypothetical protein